MANSIAYASIFQQELDRAFASEAVTGWMDANAGQVKYHGGAEVKIPSLTMQGLGNYSRAKGYPMGDITLSWETHTMTQDRGRGFDLDAMDVDESNFVATAAAVMGEFQRTQVVPEIDAYRHAKIYTLAGSTRSRTYTPAAASVLTQLMTDIGTVREKVGSGAALVVHIAYSAYNLLANSTELSKRLDVTNFSRGEVTTQVRSIDGVPLIPVRSALMKTAYTFYDGVTPSDGDDSAPTPDQTAGGFVAASGAKQINWLVMARSAPVAVSKQDLVRTFSPEVYQKKNAWHMDYRRYHDLWVPKNQLDGLYANIGA